MSIPMLEGHTLVSIVAREGAIRAKAKSNEGVRYSFEGNVLGDSIQLVRVQGDILDLVGFPLIEAKHIYTMDRLGQEQTIFVMRTLVGAVYFGFQGDARCAAYTEDGKVIAYSVPDGADQLPDDFRWYQTNDERISKSPYATRVPSKTPIKVPAQPLRRRLILRKPK